MTALFHWNPASALCLVRFPLQFNLPYYTEQSQSTAKSLEDAGCICDRTLMLRDLIKWTRAYSELSLCSISLQGPITFALTYSSSSYGSHYHICHVTNSEFPSKHTTVLH